LKEDEMQGQRLDEEKASLNLRLSRQKNLTIIDEMKEVAILSVWSILSSIDYQMRCLTDLGHQRDLVFL
jgi:hypothetical protein